MIATGCGPGSPLKQRIGVEQIGVRPSQLVEAALGRIALGAAGQAIPPALDDVVRAVDADAVRLVPQRVDFRTRGGGHRQGRQRQCNRDARRKQAALYDTTDWEHDGLVKIMAQPRFAIEEGCVAIRLRGCRGALTPLRRPPALADEALDDDRDPLADADAHGGESVPCLAASELVHQGRDDAHAARAQRMAQGDRAAVLVDALRIELEVADAGDHLRREGLVHLDAIHVACRESRACERFSRRGNRSQAHDRRIDSGTGGRQHAAQGAGVDALRIGLGHHDEACRAVVEG